VRGGGNALGGLDIDEGVLVAARLVVIHAEGKAGEQDDQARVQGQVREFGRTAVLRGGGVAGGLEQARIFIREIQTPDGRIRLERLDGRNWLERALLRRLVLQVDQHPGQDGPQDDDNADKNDVGGVFFHIL
jgi:hypothetical protein